MRHDILLHVKRFTSKTQKIGEIGEKIAEMFLVKRGFTIIEKNFTHKLGEIDIIAQKERKIYFFEVKSIVGKNSENNTPQDLQNNNVTRETYIHNVSRVTNTDIRQNVAQNDRETSVKHLKSRIDPLKRHNVAYINDTKNVFENLNDTNKDVYNIAGKHVSRETYNPFQNMSYSKMRKFAKVVQIYLAQKKVSRETRWQIDGLGVVLTKNPETGKINGVVQRIENVVIR
jgi:putative endonuclease